ncbi:adhesion G-protein coupled receptor F3-like isoform X2 [Betta splendens]|nr:adhesion G-protein coupled receptor F3-like isoform X2 [Betta splendens]
MFSRDFEVRIRAMCVCLQIFAVAAAMATNVTTNSSVTQGGVNGINVSGLVTIISPNTTVYYKSSPSLKCTFEETTDSAGWNLIQQNQSFTLNSGSVVKLNSSCATSGSSSCTEITLQGVTGDWVGMYECEFTTGSVRYTARAQLNVALLPDVITMETSPLTVDCLQSQTSVDINISATIQQSTETYGVWWSYSNDTEMNQLYNTSANGSLVYTFIGTIICQKVFVCCPYVNVTFKNTKGQETSAQVDIPVIYGLVTIFFPGTTVRYKSSPSLKCTFRETPDSAGWNLIQNNQSFTLNSGSVVKLNSSCATSGTGSCTEITIQGVTGDWVGMYECEFTTGSVRYTARAQLNVALLPDVITMETSPLTVDCSQSQTSVDINISATIQESTETYGVWWSYSNDIVMNQLYNTSANGSLVYTFIGTIICQKVFVCCPYVNVTFKNTKGQETSAQVDIPVIYDGSIFCDGIVTDGDDWPKTPAGATVTINTCAVGRVGYKSRTCIGPIWQDVYDNCINQELNTVLKQANNFQKGLGDSLEMAMNIFEGLFKSSESASSNNIADINASIEVLRFMATASSLNNIPEEVLPNFINASSNLLQMTWNVPPLILYNVSSTFLQSVDDLVKNIRVNTSQGVNSTNIDLRFCSSSKCTLSVFNVGVEMIISNGILKTAAVRNLTNKLRNNYNHTKPSKLLLSATLQDNNDSSTNIILDFPDDWQTYSKPLCVFWNTTEEDWSPAGCTAYNNDNGRTMCVCNHLTPFSVLVSKDEISAYSSILDIITNVGLSVSIFSLLVFLTIECLVWSAVVKTNLAHFRHTAMVNIAVFLLLADISMLASTRPSSLPDSWCFFLTICKHLFYLAMFCWMLCLCIMLVHQLIFVFSPLRKRVFMFVSSIVGYALPVLIVGSSYVYCKYTNIPYYNVTTCWLAYESLFVGSIQSFLLPVGTIIFINILSMLVVIVTMVNSQVVDASKADDMNTAKGIVKGLAVLTPVSGVTWIIGFLQLMLDEETPTFVAVEFLFTILNSFQGICILVTVHFKEEKVWQKLSKIVNVTFRGKSCNNTEIPLEEKSSTTNKA